MKRQMSKVIDFERVATELIGKEMADWSNFKKLVTETP